MSLFRSLLTGLALMAVPAQLSAAVHRAPARHQAPTRDWSTVTTRLPSGAFVLGNPAARVKLVEYLSLTCPHCAAFEGEAIAPLTSKYVRPGLVSYEVRHALRDAFDLAGSLLVRCDGPQTYFTLLPKVFAQQSSWFAKAEAWQQVEQANGLPPELLLPKVAAAAGFDTLLGFTSAKVGTCLANHGEEAVLTAMAGEAWRRPGLRGTPAFLIDDKLVDIGNWAELDAALTSALHTRSLPRKTPRK